MVYNSFSAVQQRTVLEENVTAALSNTRLPQKETSARRLHVRFKCHAYVRIADD
jgi:hypothetical protein